jgi:hypothetical protein
MTSTNSVSSNNSKIASASPPVSSDTASNAAAVTETPKEEPKTSVSNEDRQKAAQIYKELKILTEQGQSMESLRNTEDQSKLQQCGDLMRQRQKSSDDLRNSASGLPARVSTYLAPAAIDIKLCVSCSSAALENCKRAEGSLKQAKEQLGLSE